MNEQYLNGDNIRKRMDDFIAMRLNAVGLNHFVNKWKYSDGNIKAIFKALLTDHLFINNFKLFEAATDFAIKKEVEENLFVSDIELNDHINHKQYIAALHYFYGIKQVQIDEIEKSGMIGHRKENKSKNILNRFRGHLIEKAEFLVKMKKTNAAYDEIDQYIEKLWQ